MKVVCIALPSAPVGSAGESSAWLNVGQEYLVLSVSAAPDRRIDLQILGDDRLTPGFWDSELFITSDGRVPASWAVRIGEGGAFDMGPPRWLSPGFWEAFYEGDPDAVSSYESQLEALLRESAD